VVTHNTLVCAMLASSYPESKILITTPNRRLLHQNREEISKFLGYPVGILGDQERDIGHRVIVTTIQSLASRIEANDAEVFALLTNVDVWVCDESHGAAADSYRVLGRYLPNTHLRFGVTATWIREDGCELVMEGVLGDVQYEYTYEQAFDDGFLTPIRLWFREFHHDVTRGKRKPHYAAHYKKQIVENEGRNLQIAMDAAQLIDLKLTPCLVLVRYIEHGTRLAELLGCPFINGEQRTKEVDAVLQLLAGDALLVPLGDEVRSVGDHAAHLVTQADRSVGLVGQRIR